MLVPVEIASFAVDPQRGQPLVILRELGGGRSIAVPVDHAEAGAIAMYTLQVPVDKPLAIDLVKIMLEQLGGSLYRAVIGDVEENAFSASIIIRSQSSLKVVDCRPSDAITLAMKCGAPLFVSDAVFAKLSSESGLSVEEQLRAHVRSVDTAEFGKYVLG